MLLQEDRQHIQTALEGRWRYGQGLRLRPVKFQSFSISLDGYLLKNDKYQLPK